MRNNNDVMLLSAYLDGELSTEERTALEARLSSEPELQEQLEELRYVMALVREMPLQRAPRHYTLDPAIYGHNVVPSRKVIYPWRSLGVVAAAAVILIAGMLFFGSLGQDDPASEQLDSVVQETAGSTLEATRLMEVANLPTETIEEEDRNADDVEPESAALMARETAEVAESGLQEGAVAAAEEAESEQTAQFYDPFAGEGFDEEQYAIESGAVPPEVAQQAQGQAEPQMGGAGGEASPGFGAGGGGGEAPGAPVSEMPMPTTMPSPTERQEQDDAAEAEISMSTAVGEAPAPAPPSAADSADTGGEMSDAAASESAQAANESSPADTDLSRKAQLLQALNILTELLRRLNVLLDWNF